MSDDLDSLIKDHVKRCKTEIDNDVHTIRDEIRHLHGRVDTLSEDVHRISLTVGDMNNNLQDIAESLKKLADLPDTWDKIKGFWAVIVWLRSNLLPATTLIVLLLYIASTSDVIDVIKGLLQ